MTTRNSNVLLKSVAISALVGILCHPALISAKSYLTASQQKHASNAMVKSDTPELLKKMLNLRQPSASELKDSLKNIKRDVRLKAIRDKALILGAQAGLFWHGKILQKQSESIARSLDQIWNFNGLMLYHYRIIPPVISDIRGSQEIKPDVRVSIGRNLLVIKPARFVQAPPTWREYLLAYDFKMPDIHDIDPFFLPTPPDIKTWQINIKKGWQRGVKQAEYIMSDNIHRLSRDFNGMIRYHVLLSMNMISPPFVNESRNVVSKDTHSMSIDTRTQTITVKPMFNANDKRWFAVPAIKSAFHRTYNNGQF